MEKMTKNKAYTVYKHIAPNGKVYIGITSQSLKQRWKRNGTGYKTNEHFYRAILKYSWDNIKHEILFENLTKEEAEQKEIELIAFYKSNNFNYGYNIENGGNTNCVSEKTKLKIGIAKKEYYKKYGLPKKQIEFMLKNHARLTELSKTAEAREKRSLSKSKKIMCVELNKIYKNGLEASKELHINYANIRSVCLGIRKKAGGYHWKEI